VDNSDILAAAGAILSIPAAILGLAALVVAHEAIVWGINKVTDLIADRRGYW